VKYTLFLLLLTLASKAQQHIPLYQGNIPNAINCPFTEERFANGRITHVTHPELIAYYPTNPDSLHTAVIICPGGGYQRLAIEHEGYDVAKAFNNMGIAAFVLKYRLPNDTCVTNKKIVPLQDVQQAMYLLKTHSKEYGINTNNIGVVGFSAGGHLAATLSTQYQFEAMPFAKDSFLKPGFSVLIYPVISMKDSTTHAGSKTRLIGNNAPESDVDFFSCEQHINSTTPPAFIVLAADDKVVSPDNSIGYYTALRKNNVAAEIHIYQTGGHGFGLKLPINDSWIHRLQQWLLLNKFIKNDLRKRL
jgi:acetyl esterase/lipase